MKISRNQLCRCGSRKKYKNRCIKSNWGYSLHLKGKDGENFIEELAKKSFLEDWCYPNSKLPNGKEICDLLIVYDNIAIIWQIKNLKLDENNKFNSSEVNRNLEQISSAKRRLFELKLPIQLENPRRGKELFDPKTITQIYTISALIGKDEEDYFSFAKKIKGQIIHVFSRESAEILLNELDTIKDFIAYLKEKEALITLEKKILLFGGEKELLAYYLNNQCSFKKLYNTDWICFYEGSWKEFIKKPEYYAKKEEDKISYGWDSIINRAHTCGEDYENMARELARLSRFERRILAKTFYEAHVLAHEENKKNLFRRLLKHGDTTYVFIFLEENIPREKRKNHLSEACYVARGVFKENKKVIGIATEMKFRPTCSYDFCLIELPIWTGENEAIKQLIQKEKGIFINSVFKQAYDDEYPII